MSERDKEDIAKMLSERTLPQFSAETVGDYRAPKLGGELTMPLGTGHIGISGAVQPRPQMSPEIDLRLKYMRRF